MIKGILLDLGGVVYVGSQALPGAIAAVASLKAAGLPLRYITNTTRTPRRILLAELQGLGLAIEPQELFMPAVAARDYLATAGLVPQLLVHPKLREDFEGLPDEGEAAVVIGDAADGFTYAALNQAFRSLLEGAAFLALANNRSFRDDDDALSLDAGPFVAALEYASGRTATLLGKPSGDFFAAAVAGLGCRPEETVMVGDDVEADVGGAMRIGLKGLLVRTGKYAVGDETRIAPPPTAVLDDLAAAADWILPRVAG